MGAFRSVVANPWSCTVTLADSAAVTITWPGPVSAVQIQPEADAKILGFFGGAAPGAAGSSGTPATCYDLAIAAYGTGLMQCSTKDKTVSTGFENLSGAQVIFHFTAWPSGDA